MEYDRNGALLRTAIKELGEPRRGKVRDVYDLGDRLLLVASDRISAFDCVMANGIPDKGRVLTAMSAFWFDFFGWMPNHIISSRVEDYPAVLQPYAKDLRGRSMLVKKAAPVPVECVARGYLIGSGWKEYQQGGTVCGNRLRTGYVMADRLDAAIFTPTTKASEGHDLPVDFASVVAAVGEPLASQLRDATLRLYQTAADYARDRSIIIADTKFEFGTWQGQLILIDEVLTCDSSRFWPAASYRPGQNPPSLDKQFVRDYLETLSWNKTPPGPALPDEIVSKTREKYLAAYRQLTGRSLSG